MVRRTVALLALAASATAFTTSRSALPAPARAPVAAAAPEMKFRVCDLTGKRRNAKAMTVTFSHTRNHKVQQVNLQDRRLWWPEGDKYVKMRLSTRALKTIAKYGLNTAAKKYDVDLEQFAPQPPVTRASPAGPITKPPSSPATPGRVDDGVLDRAVHLRPSNEARRPVHLEQPRVARRVDGEV